MMEGKEFDLYKLWIEDVARLRSMRQQNTHFNTTLNLAGIGALGWLIVNRTADRQAALPDYFDLVLAIGMVFVNVSWLFTDSWFVSITKRKFVQLAELERDAKYNWVTRDAKHFDWRRVNPIGWLFGIDRVMPGLFGVAFVLFIFLKFNPTLLASLSG